MVVYLVMNFPLTMFPQLLFSPLKCFSGLLFLPFSFSVAFFVLGLFMYNFMWFIKLRAWAGMCGVCMGVCECAQVCTVHGWAWVWWKCTHVCGYTWVCIGKGDCVWDEFSEYLLETRVLTSDKFTTYPKQIFLIKWTNKKCNKTFFTWYYFSE